MRRSTAMMSRLRAQSKTGTALSFDRCVGGFLSSEPEYALKVEGKTETTMIPCPNVFPYGTLLKHSDWASSWGGLMSADEVTAMLEPNCTYTVSFEAQCISKPEDTRECGGCGYAYNEETGEEEYMSCGVMQRDVADNALGFALVHETAVDWSYVGLGIPDSADYPTVSMYVNHELSVGETYRAVVTFNTPESLEGYHLCVLTNQFYYPHEFNSPESDVSTVTFTNIQIEKGNNATPYVPFGSTDNVKTVYVEAGSEIICGQGLIVRFNPNLFTGGDFEAASAWCDEWMSSAELASMLEPNKTYTISFEAECIGRPADTTVCPGCYVDNYETGQTEYVSCGELELYGSDNALGFALIHEYAEDYSGYGLGIRDNESFPTVAMYVNHELHQGEKYRGVVTFTTPKSLEGYYFSLLTNQFYYSHYQGPDTRLSTVTFTKIKIEEGSEATPYIPFEEGSMASISSTRTTSDGSEKERIVIPCDLSDGDTWYPSLGIVVRADGSEEKYTPHPIAATCGNFDIIQEATGAEAQLSATLLSI